MTKVTTVVEYDTEDGYVVDVHNDLGFSGNLRVSADEACLKVNYPDGEISEWKEHVDDAFTCFMAHFFDR